MQAARVNVSEEGDVLEEEDSAEDDSEFEEQMQQGMNAQERRKDDRKRVARLLRRHGATDNKDKD